MNAGKHLPRHLMTMGSFPRPMVLARFLGTKVTKDIDLRSDTVTMPSNEMIRYAVNAPLGDDVMGEDPTVKRLQAKAAEMLGLEAALFLPTGTMANLTSLIAHAQYERAAEVIIGAQSHISLWEGGNASIVGGLHTRQVQESVDTAELCEDDIRDAYRDDSDDHWAKTVLLCLENTHNMMGGVALPVEYMQRMGSLSRELEIKLHVDGARLCNAAAAQNTDLASLCQPADSVSLCLSKGLGAPLGSILAGNREFIRLAKRARKRCGGGMRQSGIVAAMGLYALENHVERVAIDHGRAKRLATLLSEGGFQICRAVDTNLFYFSLPNEWSLSLGEFRTQLAEQYGVKLTGGYSKGGKLFRIATHRDLSDADIEFAGHSMVELLNRGATT